MTRIESRVEMIKRPKTAAPTASGSENIEVEAPKPLISGTPWLAWMQAVVVTTSLLLVLPVWEAGSGGFPALNPLGQFLIKDVALLGISLGVIGEATASRTSTAATRRAGT